MRPDGAWRKRIFFLLFSPRRLRILFFYGTLLNSRYLCPSFHSLSPSQCNACLLVFVSSFFCITGLLVSRLLSVCVCLVCAGALFVCVISRESSSVSVVSLFEKRRKKPRVTAEVTDTPPPFRSQFLLLSVCFFLFARVDVVRRKGRRKGEEGGTIIITIIIISITAGRDSQESQT